MARDDVREPVGAPVQLCKDDGEKYQELSFREGSVRDRGGTFGAPPQTILAAVAEILQTRVAQN